MNSAIITPKKTFFTVLKKPSYTPPVKKLGLYPLLSTWSLGITAVTST